MVAVIPKPSSAQPVLDDNGLMTREWYRFFSSLQISARDFNNMSLGGLAFKDFVDFTTSEVINKVALSVSFNPIGTDLSALNVQDALVELANVSNAAVNVTFSDVTLLTGTNNVQAVIDFIGLSTINPGTGLTGGGTIVSSPTLNLSDTTVMPGTYGSATELVQITVDQQGRITSASEIALSQNIGTPFIGALVTKSSSQAIAAGVTTALTWDQEVYDTNDFHDNVTNNTRMTIPAGVTKVICRSNITGSNQTGQLVLSLRKNGSDVEGGFLCDTDTSGIDGLNGVSSVIDVSAGDYFEVFAFSSSARDISNNVFTWFSIEAVPESTGGISHQQVMARLAIGL